MEIYGRIDDQHRFLLSMEDGEEEVCLLFSTMEDDLGADPVECDLSALAAGPVTVTCATFDGEDAWGVTEIAADEDTDEDSDEDSEEDDSSDEAEESDEAEDEDEATAHA